MNPRAAINRNHTITSLEGGVVLEKIDLKMERIFNHARWIFKIDFLVNEVLYTKTLFYTFDLFLHKDSTIINAAIFKISLPGY